MIKEGFDRFFWGFLFIMIDFRIQGFDVLPDIIGFILFALGFKALAEQNSYFAKAKTINLVMVVLSLFQIYERPAEESGIHIQPLGLVLGLVTLAFTLAVGYHLFMGIRDMASKQKRTDLEQEATQNWNYFVAIHMASLLVLILLFIPTLFIAVTIAIFIAAILLMLRFMRFMKTCGEELQGEA